MTKQTFEKIRNGLLEALAVVKGNKEPAKMHQPPKGAKSSSKTKVKS